MQAFREVPARVDARTHLSAQNQSRSPYWTTRGNQDMTNLPEALERSMLTGNIKNQIDRIWDAFWSGGISNPLEVIEQIAQSCVRPVAPDAPVSGA